MSLTASETTWADRQTDNYASTSTVLKTATVSVTGISCRKTDRYRNADTQTDRQTNKHRQTHTHAHRHTRACHLRRLIGQLHKCKPDHSSFCPPHVPSHHLLTYLLNDYANAPVTDTLWCLWRITLSWGGNLLQGLRGDRRPCLAR